MLYSCGFVKIKLHWINDFEKSKPVFLFDYLIIIILSSILSPSA